MNDERERQANHVYYLAHRERIAHYHKTHYQEHRDEIRKKQLAYYYAHRAEILKKQRMRSAALRRAKAERELREITSVEELRARKARDEAEAKVDDTERDHGTCTACFLGCDYGTYCHGRPYPCTHEARVFATEHEGDPAGLVIEGWGEA